MSWSTRANRYGAARLENTMLQADARIAQEFARAGRRLQWMADQLATPKIPRKRPPIRPRGASAAGEWNNIAVDEDYEGVVGVALPKTPVAVISAVGACGRSHPVFPVKAPDARGPA